MNRDLEKYILSKSDEIFDKVVRIREHIHANPELSYEEHDTMQYVSEQLTDIGIEHQTGVGKTGIVAIIRGDHHSETDEAIALRADLDALPINEENKVSYVSKKRGIMHACGHDVHTSILLGAAEIINAQKNKLPHPVKLIFQPGEEKNPGGATLMIADGVLKNPPVKALYALHVFPELEYGQLGFKEGIYMASCDEIYMTIKGEGGHGAMPHQCIDPIVIGANIVTNLQQIVSRKCDPKTPCVLSFGHFEAIGATNIIPSEALLKGTFRTMDEVWRKKALELIVSSAEEIAKSAGGSVEVTISKGYPYLENDPETTRKMRSAAQSFFGEENIHELPIRLTAEDFSFYSQIAPVCFFRLGVRNEEKGITYGVHHPKFDIDKEALRTGVRAMCVAAFIE